jgi:hypothetical protein
MKPSDFNTLAILIFSLDLGISTVSYDAISAFLILVSISPMGSVIAIRFAPL